MEFQKNSGEPNAIYRPESREMSTELRTCIDNCQTCHQICLQMIEHCLNRGGVHANPQHIKMLVDCAQICATSADFMIRGSAHHEATCRACADICTACAEDCEQMADDEMMKNCAVICRKCAESCSSMEMKH